MDNIEALRAARKQLEEALQEYVRLSRDGVDNVFVQDYVIAVASESMMPGYENVTLFNHLNRPAMPLYGVLGLLESARGYYRKAAGTGDNG